MTLITLCFEFFLTGLFAIGGGLATLPFLTQMGARHPEWFTQEMLVNMVAISESSPGPIGVNMATYVGYTVAGVLGAFLATFSLAFPSLIIIMIIARLLERYRNHLLVDTVFGTMRPVVVGLIASAAFTILKLVLTPAAVTGFSWINLAIMLALFALSQFKPTRNLHPILYILIGAALGITLNLN